MSSDELTESSAQAPESSNAPAAKGAHASASGGLGSGADAKDASGTDAAPTVEQGPGGAPSSGVTMSGGGAGVGFGALADAVSLGTLGAILLALIIYYWPTLTGQADFYISDLSFYFQPFCNFIGQELRAGKFPLWNPFLYSGMSQLAVPSPALFYPFSFLLFLLPFSAGLSTYMLAHQFIGAVGCILYFRRAGVSTVSACFGAVAFSLCAYMFTLIQNFTLPATVCWLPWILFFSDGIFLARSGRYLEVGAAGTQVDDVGAVTNRSSDASASGTEGDPPKQGASATNAPPDLKEEGAEPKGGEPKYGGPKNTEPKGGEPKYGGPKNTEPKGAEPKGGESKTACPNSSKTGSRVWMDVLGLGLATSMIVYCGRPEVGVPCLVLLSISAVAHFYAARERTGAFAFLPITIFAAAVFAGILLASPILLPGVEWAALSPRAQGLDAKWVLLWSANWFDLLCTLISNPFGSLYALNEPSAMVRHLVLSRAGSIPFVGSCYVSAVVYTLAFFGLFSGKKRLLVIFAVIVFGSLIMAIGSATPIAGAIIKLSPALSAFRYPVKLIIVPCLVLISLAVLGLELVIQRRTSETILRRAIIGWSVLLLTAVVAYNAPQITAPLAKIMVQGSFPIQILQFVRKGFSSAFINASLLGLLTCGLCFAGLRNYVKMQHAVLILTFALAANLIGSSLLIRQIGWPNYFTEHSFLAEKLDAELAKHSPLEASRVMNLYFDPLTVPPGYKTPHGVGDQRFFAYARDMLLHNIIVCPRIHGSFGYEAAETKDYKDYFTGAISWSSQHSKAKLEKMNDHPIHRFALLTSTGLVNTQIMRADKENFQLDKNLFETVHEDRKLNFRISRVKNARPRFAFASKIVPVESFDDLKKVILSSEDRVQTRAFDENPSMIYILHRDFEQHKAEFEAINNPTEPIAGKQTSWRLLSEDSQSLSLLGQSVNDGLFYMADHFYPGWVAELDGKPVPIYKANALNRAVYFPKGEHSLRLYYAPQSLKYGCVVAVLGALILFVSTLVSRRLRVG